MKRAALGKGISALIPEAPVLRPAGSLELLVEEISPNPMQPRRRFPSHGLAELAASIRQYGLLQPVVVTRAPEGGYHLIAGERRWRAAKQAGLERIPAVVRDAGGTTDDLALALIENLQREDLTPIEEARAYHHLRSELGLSQEDIASRVGKDRSTVANAMRLLTLPLAVQERVDDGSLSAGHARAIAGMEDPAAQLDLALRCEQEGWSVREMERRVQPRAAMPRKRHVDAETLEAADRLSATLGTKVVIHRGRRGGEIRLRFANEGELIRLFRLLAREKP
jgi:ParB family transcriptional regulator, chromosome partitioning protein